MPPEWADVMRTERPRGPSRAPAYQHPLDAGTGDLLAVVELQALEAAAGLQVPQRRVRDEQAVVQLQNPQPLVAAGAVAQVQDPVVRDELTVGQALEGGGEMSAGPHSPPGPAPSAQGSWPGRCPRNCSLRFHCGRSKARAGQWGPVCV